MSIGVGEEDLRRFRRGRWRLIVSQTDSHGFVDGRVSCRLRGIEEDKWRVEAVVLLLECREEATAIGFNREHG